MVTLFILMVYRIVLSHIIGSRGVAIFSVPNELLFLIGGSISYGIRESLSLMIDNRIAKGQYGNAMRLVSHALYTGAIFSGVFCILIVFLSRRIADGIFHIHLSYLSILLIIPALLFMILTGVFRGFFMGTGYRNIAGQSDVLFVLLYALSGSLISVALNGYGERVSALLRNEEFTFAYGAIGASLGAVVSSFICFIHIVILYFLMRHRTVLKDERDFQRTQESPGAVMLNILLNGLMYMGLFAVFSALVLPDILAYFASGEENASYLWGEYYGKVLPTAAIFGIIVMFVCYSYVRKAVSAVRREEYRNAREKLERLIHRCAGVGIFISVMLLVLADNIVNIVFTNNGSNTVTLLQLSAVTVMFSIFAVMLLELIILMQYHKLALTLAGIAFLVHTVLTVVFVDTLHLSLMGVVIGNMIFFALLAVASFVFVSRAFQYTQEWFRAIAVTLIAALCSGLIGMLLNKAMTPVAGSALSMGITFLLCILLYMIILLALHGYREEELLESPVGRVMLVIGRTVRLL